MNLRTGIVALALALVMAQTSRGAEITGEVTWSGVVTVKEDTRVGPAATLTILAGTKIYVLPAESTKTEPTFWNPDTEIAVEGRLIVKGEGEKPVVFAPETGQWGGLAIAPGGKAQISHAAISGADEAVLLAGGSLEADAVTVSSSSVGLVIGPNSTLKANNLTISSCSRGVVDLRGEVEGMPEGVASSKNTDADYLRQGWRPATPKFAASAKAQGQAREFVGEYTVYGEETWKGKIILNGRVTVPPGSTLKIDPGANILFRKRDTNGDGLGEGELLILGSVRCMGTKDNPVVFDSAEDNPAPGDWDKVSIISSDDAENSFEFAVFRHGTMALHAHFSSFTASDCVFEENLRALQFQESEKALVLRSTFVGNKQAMRFRDSKVVVDDCALAANDYAFHIFRSTVTIKDSTIEDTLLGGLLAKESTITIANNEFIRSRAAMKLKGTGSTLTVSDNKLIENVETALSLSDVKVLAERNVFDAAGLDLIGVERGDAVFRGNSFRKSGRSAIHLNSAGGADASCNDWGGEEPKKRIYHYEQDKSLGVIVLNGKCN